jgi:hypothetical protein
VFHLLSAIKELKCKIKNLELIVLEQAIFTRVFDIVYELSRFHTIQSIYFVIKFKLEQGSRVSGETEYMEQQLKGLKKFLSTSFPCIDGGRSIIIISDEGIGNLVLAEHQH